MRRWLGFGAVLVFLIPAMACGSTTGAATKTASAAPTAAVAASSPPTGAATRAATVAANTAPSTAASAAPASAAPKGIYPPNTLVSVKNWDMALNRVEHPGKTLTWSQYNNVSNAAGEWVVVIFDMKNTGNTNFGVNQGDFQLLADGGITYRPSTDGGAIIYSSFKGGQNIGSQTPPGVSVTYYIPFDVAPGATGLTFQFNQDTKPKFTLP